MAQNDGFTILTTAVPGTEIADVSSEGYPVAEIIRYKDGIRAWVAPVSGPSVHDGAGSVYSILWGGGDLVDSCAKVCLVAFCKHGYKGSLILFRDCGVVYCIFGGPSIY